MEVISEEGDQIRTPGFVVGVAIIWNGWESISGSRRASRGRIPVSQSR